jgi:hypothetical protein
MTLRVCQVSCETLMVRYSKLQVWWEVSLGMRRVLWGVFWLLLLVRRISVFFLTSTRISQSTRPRPELADLRHLAPPATVHIRHICSTQLSRLCHVLHQLLHQPRLSSVEIKQHPPVQLQSSRLVRSLKPGIVHIMQRQQLGTVL